MVGEQRFRQFTEVEFQQTRQHVDIGLEGQRNRTFAVCKQFDTFCARTVRACVDDCEQLTKNAKKTTRNKITASDLLAFVQFFLD